ncbi:MAG: hypothetical protein CMH57_05380 [Myxococcales bacterium]|nr:hypothetical protein [Myxococcales bacterium]
MRAHPLHAALLAAALLATACGNMTDRSQDGLRTLLGPGLQHIDPAWDTLLSGNTDQAREALSQSGADQTPEGRAWRALGRCDANYLLGHYKEALAACVETVEATPAKPPAQWALMRLESMRALSPGFSEGVAPALMAIQKADATPEGVQSPVLTRYLAARVGMARDFELWYRSDSEDPFSGDPHGVPTVWSMVGPTSLYANLDLGETSEPERDDALADTYELLGFTRRTSREQTNGLQANPSLSLSGVYVAETWVTVDRGGRFDVAANLQGSGIVFIDGERVLVRDARQELGPAEVVARDVELTPGVHRIRVRLAYERGYRTAFGVMLLPRRQGTRMTFSPTPPKGQRGQVEGRGEVAPWIGEGIDLGRLSDDRLRLYLAAWMATEFVEEAIARDALARLEELAPDFAGTWLVRAKLMERLWSLPGKVRSRETIKAIRKATEVDPKAGRALLWLASELREQGLKDDAADAIAALQELRPDEASTWAEAARYYRWRAFPTQAEEALARATELDSRDCGLIQELDAVYRDRDFAPKREEIPDAWFSCDLFRWRYARNVELMRGEHATLMKLLERDVKRYPWRTWSWAALARGKVELEGEEAGLEAINRGLALHPGEQDLLKTRSDLLARLGRLDEARETLREALKENQGAFGLHRALALLNGQLPLADLTANGIAAIRDYERDPVAFPSDAIYVLDYMARRYFEDGSSADVTHLVVRVQSKAGLDEYGEVRFPRGAIPLMARTVKRNGAVVEPVREKDKPVISMPSLDVGDYIEYAYLTFNGRNPARQGSSVGAKFFFRMSNIASARSEFIVEVPEAWKPDFVSRNDAPPIEESSADGYTRYRFIRTSSAQPRQEPMSVDNDEYLPHVQLIHRYTWEDTHRAYQDQLITARASAPMLTRRAQELTRGKKSDMEKVRAIWRFANTHVRTRRFLDFSTTAAHIEASGEGNPVVLMSALLGEVGIETEIVKIRGATQDPAETAIPAFGAYNFTALKVSVDGETLWLNPVGRNARFNYLPVSVQGQPAIRVEPGADLSRITIPTWPAELERRDVRFDLTLSAEGDLTGEVTETLRGQYGIGRRDYYDEQGSEDNIRKYVERKVNYDFNGSELLEYTIRGRDEPDAELVLTYRFKRDGYARRAPSGALVIQDRYDLMDLMRSFARLPERTVPMLIDDQNHDEVHVALTAPEGTRVLGPGGPDTLTYNSAFGEYSRTVEREANTIRIHHRLFVPIQRISPEAYAEFAEWAGDIDRATYGRLEITKAP